MRTPASFDAGTVSDPRDLIVVQQISLPGTAPAIEKKLLINVYVS